MEHDNDELMKLKIKYGYQSMFATPENLDEHFKTWCNCLGDIKENCILGLLLDATKVFFEQWLLNGVPVGDMQKVYSTIESDAISPSNRFACYTAVICIVNYYAMKLAEKEGNK